MAASASPSPDHPLASPETLLDWVEQHPDLQHLKADQRSAAPPPLWRQLAGRIRGLMVASPADFHGTAYVTAATHKDSQLVASGVTASNWIDGAGNFSLFLFACGAGNPLGWVTASVLTGLLFKFDKDICTTVARGRKGNHRVALVAILFGLVPLSLLKSFGTGLGVEVLQNRTQLEQLQATKIVNGVLDDKRRQLKRLETPDAGTAAVQAQCRTGQATLSRLAYGDPRWMSLQVELYGEWSQRRTDWSRTTRSGQRPICVELKLLEDAQRQRVAAERERLETTERERLRFGNDQRFLQNTFPERFAATFEPDGAFRSPVQLVTVGIENFFTMLSRGQWAAMGLSIYVLSFSLITSTVVCALVIAHSRRPGVALSWSDDVRQERDRWLAEQLDAYDSSAVAGDNNTESDNGESNNGGRLS